MASAESQQPAQVAPCLATVKYKDRSGAARNQCYTKATDHIFDSAEPITSCRAKVGYSVLVHLSNGSDVPCDSVRSGSRASLVQIRKL